VNLVLVVINVYVIKIEKQTITMGIIDVDFVIVTQYYVMRMNMFQVINVQHVLGDQQMLLVMIQLVLIQYVKTTTLIVLVHGVIVLLNVNLLLIGNGLKLLLKVGTVLHVPLQLIVHPVKGRVCIQGGHRLRLPAHRIVETLIVLITHIT
tara:strand:- start:12 stop:461 length:450 start_codon:yes stop_codon:yes gene_type:complete